LCNTLGIADQSSFSIDQTLPCIDLGIPLNSWHKHEVLELETSECVLMFIWNPVFSETSLLRRYHSGSKGGLSLSLSNADSLGLPFWQKQLYGIAQVTSLVSSQQVHRCGTIYRPMIHSIHRIDTI
jgi:hypothetical protein